jgi:predicted metal-dependent enzyme (double-stranded beta helix superfamily)
MGVPSNLAEHNKYLILFVKRITWSPRAYTQFHNHNRQLVSLYSMQKCHTARESA